MKTICFSVFLNLFFLLNFVCAQTPSTNQNPSWQGKRYAQMGYDEKLRFVSAKSDEILALFGRTPGDEIGDEGLNMIRRFLDGYVTRSKQPTMDSCSAETWLKSDLTSIIKRGSRRAAVIREEFVAQKLPPQTGIYVAMLESEFCSCFQGATGQLGMFAWVSSSGSTYGLKTVRGATASTPDERCDPRLSARAAAKYLRFTIDDIFGADAVGIPLAIGAYNSGEGSAKKHIADVAKASTAQRISFWVLLTSEVEAPKQFQNENFKYVPKFFAAAIIGENPQTFGIDLPPLSQTKN